MVAILKYEQGEVDSLYKSHMKGVRVVAPTREALDAAVAKRITRIGALGEMRNIQVVYEEPKAK